MNILIIEDEDLAAKRLAYMVKNFDPLINILGVLESVEESIYWFNNNDHPDLIFLDIHLEDELSFLIFEKVNISSPIIFTTAFDEYAIRAFKLKSIDYLLKPINQDELNKALQKYYSWNKNSSESVNMTVLYDMIQKKSVGYKERFSVSYGQKIRSLMVVDIAYFYSNQGGTYVVLKDKKHYPLDYSLDKIAAELNPNDFFRINRQLLVRHDAIRHVVVYPKSRLKLELSPNFQEDVFLSIDRVVSFKKWFGE